MTQPVWTLTDKEKIKKTLELIQDFEIRDHLNITKQTHRR